MEPSQHSVAYPDLYEKPVYIEPVPPAATQQGTVSNINVFATTTNAVAGTVNTHAAPSAGHADSAAGTWNVTDRTADTTFGAQFSACSRNYAGTTAIAGQSNAIGAVGDAALNTCTITFSIVAGAVNVTFTPPAGYVGTLDWFVTIKVIHN